MKLIHFESIDSTNKYLKENYQNLDNFIFVSTSSQTSGKGRNDRKWLSNKGENLLFSFLVKDKELLAKFGIISIGTATLVARFLELQGIKNVSVKWPNDVYVNDKKICGILLEGDVNTYLVVGVGLNINQKEFIGEYRITPTSMNLEIHKDFDLDLLGNELFSFLEKHINQKEFKAKTCKFLNEHNYLKNKRVSIGDTFGIVTGFNSNLEILIDDKPVNSGEITIIND